jgi:hypothetical protein
VKTDSAWSNPARARFTFFHVLWLVAIIGMTVISHTITAEYGAGSRKPEAGSRKPEAGSRKRGAGSRKLTA